jgi:transposase-like protein
MQCPFCRSKNKFDRCGYTDYKCRSCQKTFSLQAKNTSNTTNVIATTPANDSNVGEIVDAVADAYIASTIIEGVGEAVGAVFEVIGDVISSID